MRRIFAVLAACWIGVVSADDNSVVVLMTDLGEITIEVFEDRAPVSAGSFLAHVDTGSYDGAAFYRVVRPDNDNGEPVISVIQGGLLEADNTLPPVAHETTSETGVLHEDGVISLARAEPGTGSGAAFFICVGAQPALDFGGSRNADGQGFAAFGKVIGGMDVVHNIHQREAQGPSCAALSSAWISGSEAGDAPWWTID